LIGDNMRAYPKYSPDLFAEKIKYTCSVVYEVLVLDGNDAAGMK
jgi:hypothetical protein